MDESNYDTLRVETFWAFYRQSKISHCYITKIDLDHVSYVYLDLEGNIKGSYSTISGFLSLNWEEPPSAKFIEILHLKGYISDKQLEKIKIELL
jgi:hypothetical protein